MKIVIRALIGTLTSFCMILLLVTQAIAIGEEPFVPQINPAVQKPINLQQIDPSVLNINDVMKPINPIVLPLGTYNQGNPTSGPCGGVPVVIIDFGDMNTIQVRDVLTNIDNLTDIPNLDFSSFKSSQDGNYYVCFEFKDEKHELVDNTIAVDASFLSNENLIIKGLRLEAKNEFTDPLLSITGGGSGHVIIEDLDMKDVKNGLVVESGNVVFKNSKITGDPSREGYCVNIRSDGTIVEGVEISGCGEGIHIEANNVHVRDESEIYDNGIGIHVVNGFQNLNFIQSSVFGNNDGDPSNEKRFDAIRIDSLYTTEKIFDVDFYKVVNDKYQVQEINEDGFLHYSNGIMYIDVPDFTQNGRIELFRTLPEECTDKSVLSYGQVCGLVENGITEINKESLPPNEIYKIQIPESRKGKATVAVFTSDNTGSTTISRPFISEDGVVAFVNAPYDIPTSGAADAIDVGVTGDGVDAIDVGGPDMDYAEDNIETEGGSSMDGDSSGGVDFGGVGAAGGCGGGGSSIIASHGMHFYTLGTLGWIMLALALIGSIRVVTVRIMKRDQ